MPTHTMYYVEARKGNTTIKQPIWPIDPDTGNIEPRLNAHIQANIAADTLEKAGWATYTTDSDGNVTKRPPKVTSEVINQQHPHYRPQLANQEGNA